MNFNFFRFLLSSFFFLFNSFVFIYGRNVTIDTKGLMTKGEEAVQIEIEWDESWFYKSQPTNYNHNIARIAVLFSEISYVSVEENHQSNELIKAYRKLGFNDSDTTINYTIDYKDNPSGDNQAAYSFASKDIQTPEGKKKLVFIILRGTPLGANEWLSNINISNTTQKNVNIHEGFKKTSEIIIENLKDYMSEKKINADDSYFLMTGHSRGGALANLMAAMLYEMEVIKSSNFFVYTFAAPNVVQKSSQIEKNYDFIWNIVNAEDMIPSVPPRRNDWHWSKFGQTKVLANYWNTNPQIYTEEYIPRMNEYYEKLLKRSYVPFQNGPFIQIQCSRLLTSMYKDVEGYYGTFFGLHSLAERIFKKAFSEKKDEKENNKENPSIIYKALQKLVNNNIQDGFDNMVNAFVDMHACETYLSWMMALEENEIFSTLGSSQLIISGNYDCAVFDDEENLLARIRKGSVEINTIKAPAAAFPLLDSNVIGFAGNQNLNVVIHKDSIIPTVLKYYIEHYDAEGILISTTEKKYLFPHMSKLISFKAGIDTLESNSLDIKKLTWKKSRPIINQYELKQNLDLKIQPEIAMTENKFFSAGLRIGAQDIFATFNGEFYSNECVGLTAGFGHEKCLYGPLYIDLEVLSKIKYVKIDDSDRKFRSIPGARFSLSLKPRKRFQIFASSLFDLKIKDYNDDAFIDTPGENIFDEIELGDNVKIVPTLQFGIRF